MSKLEQAVADLAAAVRYEDTVKAAKVEAYRSMLNVAVVLAVLSVLVTVAAALV